VVTEKIRSKEVRSLKLRPMALAPAATFKFRNELNQDLELSVEGNTVIIRSVA